MKLPLKSVVQFREGNYSLFDNIAGQLSRCFQVTVPKNQVWEIDPDRPFLAYLMCKDLGLTPSQAAGGTVTVNHGILVPKVAGGGDAPIGRYEVLVGTVGGTKQRLTITQRTATTLTFSETVDADTKVDAFYIPSTPARFQLRVEDPRHMTTLDQIWLHEDAGVIMIPDPFDIRSMYSLQGKTVIPPDFILSLWIDAPYSIAWQDTAANPQNLRAVLHLPIIIHPRSRLPAEVDEQVMQILSRG